MSRRAETSEKMTERGVNMRCKLASCVEVHEVSLGGCVFMAVHYFPSSCFDKPFFLFRRRYFPTSKRVAAYAVSFVVTGFMLAVAAVFIVFSLNLQVQSSILLFSCCVRCS